LHPIALGKLGRDGSAVVGESSLEAVVEEFVRGVGADVAV